MKPAIASPSVVEIVDEKIAAEFIGMSVSYLRKARSGATRFAPPHLRIGRAVRYDLRDLSAWLETRRVRGDR